MGFFYGRTGGWRRFPDRSAATSGAVAGGEGSHRVQEPATPQTSPGQPAFASVVTESGQRLRCRGCRCCQPIASSSRAPSPSSRGSAPCRLPAGLTPTGRPAGVTSAGNETAGRPLVLSSGVWADQSSIRRAVGIDPLRVEVPHGDGRSGGGRSNHGVELPYSGDESGREVGQRRQRAEVVGGGHPAATLQHPSGEVLERRHELLRQGGESRARPTRDAVDQGFGGRVVPRGRVGDLDDAVAQFGEQADDPFVRDNRLGVEFEQPAVRPGRPPQGPLRRAYGRVEERPGVRCAVDAGRGCGRPPRPAAAPRPRPCGPVVRGDEAEERRLRSRTDKAC